MSMPEMSPSPSGTASLNSVPTQNRPSPDGQKALQDAIHVRYLGRYYDSEAQFKSLPANIGKQISVLNELAISYVFQGNFRKLLGLFREPDILEIESKDDSLSKLLLDYSRMHTDLMLAEAVETASNVWDKWLANRNIEEYDDVDLYMVCFYHIIQEWGRRLLGNDDWETADSPGVGAVRALRKRLLSTNRIEQVLMIEFVHCDAHTGPVASTIQDALAWFSSESSGSSHKDVGASFHYLLSFALYNQSKWTECMEELRTARQMFKECGNLEGCLWVQLALLTFVDDVPPTSIPAIKQLMDEFARVEQWKGVQRCAFAIAKIEQKATDEVQYYAILTSLIKLTIGNSLTEYSQPMIWKTDLLDAAQQTPEPLNRGSMFSFWALYLDILPDDLRSERNTPLFLEIGTLFFTLHPRCSIPQMQYLLAVTLSEQYEQRLGDNHMGLHWILKAEEYAENEAQKDEIAHKRRFLLSTANIRVLDDPSGVKQMEWDIARRRDLEILYEEHQESGRLNEQYDCAIQLLYLQLDAEAQMHMELTGEPWLSTAKSLIPYFPDNIGREKDFYIDFALAHKLFESSELAKAVETLNKLSKACDRVNSIDDYERKARTFLTLGRTHLILFTQTKDMKHWQLAKDSIEAASQIAMDISKPDEVACCHCVLASLWRSRGTNDEATLSALFHVKEAERLWGAERNGYRNLGGLDGLLSRYSLRVRNEFEKYDIYSIAFDACFARQDFDQAWEWAQRAKAKAFSESLLKLEAPTHIRGPRNFEIENNLDGSLVQDITDGKEGIVCVDWVTADDTIYLITIRSDKTTSMHRLNITLTAVNQWYKDLIDAKDDLSDADLAEETLSEISCLLEPLANPTVSKPGELLIFCPTKVLSKIPLHALKIDNDVLLERNPVVYTHTLSVLRTVCTRAKETTLNKRSDDAIFFGNPTEDTPAGAESVVYLRKSLKGEVFLAHVATRETFIEKSASARLIHYHGHVVVDESPLNNGMIFHDSSLKARDVFVLDLNRFAPFICIIGCSSGNERPGVGDEPLGLVSSFIFAGASAVVATLWPIHDSLSGAAFSREFYKVFESVGQKRSGTNVVDLATSLQSAALAIRRCEETRAPYFWAGFLLHGSWRFNVDCDAKLD